MDLCAPPRRSPSDLDRQAALAIAEHFRSVHLTKFLWRLGGWKGFDANRRTDLFEDLGQELYVIALEDAELLVGQDPHTRRRHLMRSLQRAYYRLEWRNARCEIPDVFAVAKTIGPYPDSDTGAPASILRDPRLRELARVAAHRGNGRIHSGETAAHLQVSPKAIRKLLLRAADALGFDGERERFWTNRLGEALLGEAAARLLDAGLPKVWRREQRRRLEPRAAYRRISRILEALHVRPQCHDLRRVLVRFARLTRPGFERWSPARLLELAGELLPGDPRVALWQFEEAAHHGRLAEAERALTTAETFRADAIRLMLARARLDELRGHRARAEHRLAQALLDHPHDPRLQRSRQALRAAEAVPPRRPGLRYAPSAARRRSTTCRSKRA